YLFGFRCRSELLFSSWGFLLYDCLICSGCIGVSSVVHFLVRMIDVSASCVESRSDRCITDFLVGVAHLVSSFGGSMIVWVLVFIWSMCIRKCLECMSSNRSVIRLTVMVLVFGNPRPYGGRVYMRR
ncbi:hypothetical protein BDD12DRAFT_926793, partial [Trichophaea hybrida]